MSTVNRITPGDGDPRHGTWNGYHNHKCRCDDCREAWREYHNRWMNAKPERLAAHRDRQRRRRAKS